MRTTVLFFWLTSAVFAVPACVSSGGEVVSRSAQDRPSWADGNIPEEPPKAVLAVYKKTDVFRLELGIRQAQAEALAGAKRLMQERLKRELAAVAGEVLAGGAGEVAAPLGNAVESYRLEAPEASPYRVYHEELRKETDAGPRISYDIFVLVSMPRTAFDEALHAIAKTLTAASDARLNKVGNEIVRRLEGETTTQE